MLRSLSLPSSLLVILFLFLLRPFRPRCTSTHSLSCSGRGVGDEATFFVKGFLIGGGGRFGFGATALFLPQRRRFTGRRSRWGQRTRRKRRRRMERRTRRRRRFQGTPAISQPLRLLLDKPGKDALMKRPRVEDPLNRCSQTRVDGFRRGVSNRDNNVSGTFKSRGQRESSTTAALVGTSPTNKHHTAGGSPISPLSRINYNRVTFVRGRYEDYGGQHPYQERRTGSPAQLLPVCKAGCVALESRHDALCDMHYEGCGFGTPTPPPSIPIGIDIN